MVHHIWFLIVVPPNPWRSQTNVNLYLSFSPCFPMSESLWVKFGWNLQSGSWGKCKKKVYKRINGLMNRRTARHMDASKKVIRKPYLNGLWWAKRLWVSFPQTLCLFLFFVGNVGKLFWWFLKGLIIYHYNRVCIFNFSHYQVSAIDSLMVSIF